MTPQQQAEIEIYDNVQDKLAINIYNHIRPTIESSLSKEIKLRIHDKLRLPIYHNVRELVTHPLQQHI